MRTKQVRPDKLDFEYELYVYRDTDNVTLQKFLAFDFRTKKVFENFAYNINVVSKIVRDRSELSFNIEGLSAPRLDFSKAGPASYIYKYYDFKNGEYDLYLSKYKKQKNHFKIGITAKGIELLLNPENRFINVITEEHFVS